MKIVKEESHPTGLTRFLLKLPVNLYRFGLGGVLGSRMLLIHHVGRVTGKAHQTVVEVIRHEGQDGGYLVASGWGPGTDWYRNLLRTPRTNVQVGRRTRPVTVVPLPEDEATEIVAEYFWQHRRLAKRFLRLYGYVVDGTKADYREVAKRVPVLRFVPAA